MKVLFAIYDKNDNFIDCGFSYKEMCLDSETGWRYLHRNKGCKIYQIPLEVQNDIFKEADEQFIKEFGEQCYTDEENAQMRGISIRTWFRRKAKGRLV